MKKHISWNPDQDKRFFRRIRIALISTVTAYVIYIALVLLLCSGCKKAPCYTCFAFTDNGTVLRDTDYLCGESAKDAYYHTWEWESGYADVTVQCYEE